MSRVQLSVVALAAALVIGGGAFYLAAAALSRMAGRRSRHLLRLHPPPVSARCCTGRTR
jgi:hypothetical protein